MQNITKIAAIENATTIWEYNPSWADNCVLGGSLDVIAAICMLAIKVRPHLILSLYNSTDFSLLRYKLLDNKSSTSTTPSYIAVSWKVWRFHYTAMSDGEQPSRWLTRHTNSVRYVHALLLLKADMVYVTDAHIFIYFSIFYTDLFGEV